MMTSINTTTKDLPTWHFNLTRTMADVWGIEPSKPPPLKADPVKRERLPRQSLSGGKIRYAGAETDRRAL